MRIIHGTYSGRRLHIPKSLHARPTTDLARESLFNILINRIDFENKKILDLFSGTGSISFEFASLGALYVTAIELKFKHVEAIKKNCHDLGIDTIKVMRSDVFRFLAHTRQKYDVIFADPPFDHPELANIPNIIKEQKLLNPDGIFILEHGPKNAFEEIAGYQESRQYGKVHFSFFTF